jgi:YggT family protein
VGIYLAMGLVIVAAVMSWINPYAPLAPLFSALAAPLLRPFQRLLPPIGGVDLSPLALLLVLQVLLAVLANVEGLFLPRVIH